MTQTAREILETLYTDLNRPELISPDPLEVVIEYENIEDREIIGLIAASLAFGRVKQIVQSVRKAVEPLGKKPHEFINSITEEKLRNILPDFKHRFVTGREIGSLFIGIKRALARHGSLNNCFLTFVRPDDEDILPALAGFTQQIACDFPECCSFLTPSPQRRSACKRMNLFLKWMVRRDNVDPGGWQGISPSRLVVPTDTHIFSICKKIGMTKRSSPDIITAKEITGAFCAVNPEDPTKYDFAITRLGIRSELTPNDFVRMMSEALKR